MKISKKDVKRAFTLAISICFINFSYCSIQSFAYTQTESTKVTEEKRKREILKKYPPNLSEMQEIGFGVKTVNQNGELIEKTVRPDVHFRGENGKEYLIFYNNHIEQLRDIIHKKVENSIDENKYALIGDKGLIRDVSDGKVENFGVIQCLRLIPYSFKAFFNKYEETFFEIFKNAVSSGRLKNAVKKYGGSLDNTNTPCWAIVARDLSETISVENMEGFEKIEREFYDIMTSHSPYKSKVEQLNKLLDNYLNKSTPEASNIHTMFFCFPLNRTSYYLSNLEKNLQDKDLETLSAMYALREKINRLTLEHRFIFEQNRAPILNIRIDRCKIIVEDMHRTMIFLDREETKKFITKAEKMLDTQASEISKTYSFEGFSGKRLRELAESLNLESFQDIIDNENQELNRMEAESSKILADVGTLAGRAAIRLFQNSASLKIKSNSGVSNNDFTQEFSEEEVKEYLETQKQNDNNSDRKDQHSLNQMINSLNLTPFEKSSLNRAFEKYLEYRIMQSDIKLKSSKRDFLNKVKTNKEDFINLFKLYILMVRGGYASRDDFYGVTIEENRCDETLDGRGRLMRKYFVEEIQRLDDVL